MPSQGGSEKYTLLTSGDKTLLDIHTSFNQAATIQDFSNGGQIPLTIDGQTVMTDVARVGHVRISSHVVPTPTARRKKIWETQA